MCSPHPELAQGEMFLTNCASQDDYEEIGWLTKRLGTTAYDVIGKPIDGYRPVFVWTSESS
jgi:hypothetical protein